MDQNDVVRRAAQREQADLDADPAGSRRRRRWRGVFEAGQRLAAAGDSSGAGDDHDAVNLRMLGEGRDRPAQQRAAQKRGEDFVAAASAEILRRGPLRG